MKKPRGTLALVSLGCAKNAVDLQLRAGALVKDGWTLSPDPDRADCVIVNTCSFIAAAREEAEAEIRRALELKARGQYGRVVVTGCYPQRYPQLKRAFPGVDEWIGVPKEWEEPAVPALRLTGKAFAYLKIAEGCAHRCSYCAIPLIRGKYRSRPKASILREARALVKTGCRELNVVAQDPMLWREGDERLADLLWAIDKIPGDFWVRVLYTYPSEITEEFVIWLSTSKHAVRYVDVPIQHTVPEVLEKMNRKRAIEPSRCAAEVLREIVPDVTLRTTVMTGFPGETEARFNAMLADLKRMQFDHLGAFAYSPEEGTKGAKMKGRPSRAVAEERERLVREQQAKIWHLKAKRFVGRTFRALVVAPGVARLASQAPDVDGVTYIQRTVNSEQRTVGGEQRTVNSEQRTDCVGEFVNVKILKVKGFDFIAEVVA
jgi:ribosomal protein S12 methylthiotransferase